MATISEVKNNLTGMLSGTTLNRVTNLNQVFERAANTVNTNIDAIETERTQALQNTVHDNVYNYTLNSDFKKLIDLFPQDNRTSRDRGARRYAEPFDAEKLVRNKQISIEGDDGTKFIRINWRSRAPITVSNMNSLTANGTWGAVGSASNLATDDLFRVSGSSSIRFDVNVSGDGLQNTGLSSLDLEKLDELADFFQWLYFPSVSALTSITGIWGNDVSSAFWTSVAQTSQFDATAFKIGWNLIRFPWATATETGTVDPATIDSFKFTIATTGAIAKVRADNITTSLGRNFDLKYYSQFAFKNTAGTFIIRPTSDDDEVVYQGTAFQIFLLECLKAIRQQLTKGNTLHPDIIYARRELNGDPSSPDPVQRRGLYASYRAEYPSMSKKSITTWSTPRSGNANQHPWNR